MLLGRIYVQDNFLRERQEKTTAEPDVLSVMASGSADLAVGDMTPLALNQYIDFDSECSGLFGDHEIEAAKHLMKDG
jgi:hypothetical protein